MKNIKTNLKEALQDSTKGSLNDYLEKLKYKYRLNNNWVFIEDNARTIDLPSDFFDVLNIFHVERVEFTNTKIIAHILEIGEYEGKLEFEGKNIIFHSNGYWELDKFYYPTLVTDLLKTQMKNIFSIYETIPECNVSAKDIFNTCKKHGITLKKPLNTLHVYYKDLEKHVPVWVKIIKEGNWYEISGKIE